MGSIKLFFCDDLIKSLSTPLWNGGGANTFSLDNEALAEKFEMILEKSASISKESRPDDENGAQTDTANTDKLMPENLQRISNREIQILKLLMQGESVKSTAKKANISTHTVGSHMKRIYKKLGVNSKNEAIYSALPLLLPN